MSRTMNYVVLWQGVSEQHYNTQCYCCEKENYAIYHAELIRKAGANWYVVLEKRNHTTKEYLDKYDGTYYAVVTEWGERK